MRNRFQKSRFVSQVIWTVEMDTILIEHSALDIQELVSMLNVDETEIIQRKRVLGLIKRHRQFRKVF